MFIGYLQKIKQKERSPFMAGFFVNLYKAIQHFIGGHL